MSLLNEASFLVTPNGYKEDKLYAAIPTNGNGDMTVTRGSTATRVNESGLVELVPYNLLSRSQEFDNGVWVKINSTVTANTVIAPDGTLTGDTLNISASGLCRQILSTTAGATYSVSAWVKKASISGATNIRITTNNTYAWNSGISQQFALTTAWQKITISGIIISSGTSAYIIFGTPDVSGGSDATCIGNVDIWGAQLVEGSSALTYQKTVDRLDIPRIDYTGGGCPSILLEPQRTNIVLRSQEFDNASFAKYISSVSANTTTAPDGTLTADTWTGNGSYGQHILAQVLSATSGVAYTHSVFAKKGTNNFIQILGIGVIYDNNSWANFDLNTGVVGTAGISATATITDFGNGWYRCTMTATATATTSSNGFQLCLITSATAGRAESNSLATSVHLWGAQLEAGAYPTSYIPTTTASVTRNADAVVKTGISDLINSEEGVLFVEMAATSFDSNYDVITLSDGTNNNVVGIFYYANNKSISVSVKQLGSSVFTGSASTITYPPLDFHKIAVKYKTGDSALWIDGTEVLTGSGALTNLGLSNLQLADGNGTQNKFFGKVKQLQVYKTALTDTQLAALTT